jgi:hypothetical protein
MHLTNSIARRGGDQFRNERRLRLIPVTGILPVLLAIASGMYDKRAGFPPPSYAIVWLRSEHLPSARVGQMPDSVPLTMSRLVRPFLVLQVATILLKVSLSTAVTLASEDV